MSDAPSPAVHDVLRFITAGSVDDGKSTLIGRLLYDTKTIFEDQLEHVEDASKRRGDERLDLALLTDGLRAEREQGITIDVAYRYFSTPRRKFIIADAPGHAQYTRNMVTGASTANLAVVLVDARHGVVEQTRRHTIVASLLGVPHLVFAINKMDLVDFSQARFDAVRAEVTALLTRLRVRDVTFIPMSALTGDNVVERSPQTPWYRGPALLEHLETVHIASDRNLIDVRMPVQWVIRPQSDQHAEYRGYTGVVAGGVLKAGDEAMLLPAGLRTTIERIEVYGREVPEAFPPMAATVHLADQVDVSRGDMLCRPGNQPIVGRELEAMVVWFSDDPLRRGARYALKHTTRWLRATVSELRYELDVETLHRDASGDALTKNAIGRVRLRATAPVCYDPYERNRTTGSFILVDEATHDTVGAGMLLPPTRGGDKTGSESSQGVFVTGTNVRARVGLASCGLVHALHNAGVRAVGMLPVATGCDATDAGLRSRDAQALQAASGLENYASVNPFALAPSGPPHVAAAESNVDVSLDVIEAAYRDLAEQGDAVVVQGCGGYRAPIDADGTIAEIPRRLGLGVVMVVTIGPGCFSHALLTAEAIAADGLSLLGWVADCRDAGTVSSAAQLDLTRRLGAPLLGVLPAGDEIDAATLVLETAGVRAGLARVPTS